MNLRMLNTLLRSMLLGFVSLLILSFIKAALGFGYVSDFIALMVFEVLTVAFYFLWEGVNG